MKCLSFALVLSLTACGGAAEWGDDGSARRGASPTEQPDSATEPGSAAAEGMPCRFLHGTATLSDYGTSAYASSAFSFEFASQDPNVTHNEFDVLYERNMFRVNMVTDDASFIVDLGVLPIRDVPATVDPGNYPRGNWDEHDSIDAHLDHTYFVRSVDGSGGLVSAFRIVGLEPGHRVTIEWIRSTAPDAMIVPSRCF